MRPSASKIVAHMIITLWPKPAMARIRSGQARSGVSYAFATGPASASSASDAAPVTKILSLIASATTVAMASGSPRRSAMKRAALTRDAEVGRDRHQAADAHSEREHPVLLRPEVADQENRQHGRERGTRELRGAREDRVTDDAVGRLIGAAVHGP